MCDRNGGRRLRQWLIEQIDSTMYPGLIWENDEKTMFRIPWKHAGKQDYNQEVDASIFKVETRPPGSPQSCRAVDVCLLSLKTQFCFCFFFFLNILIWLYQVLVVAGKVFDCRTLTLVVPVDLFPAAGEVLVPQPGIEPMFSELQGRFLTTGPQGKSCSSFLKQMLIEHVEMLLNMS